MYAAAIQAFDRDGNGELDLHEIAAAVKALADARAQNKMLKTAVIVAGVCSLLIVAAVVGLTFAVVTLVKDTKMDNNVMVNKETGAPVEVRNMDLSVVGGALTSPGSEDTLGEAPPRHARACARSAWAGGGAELCHFAQAAAGMRTARSSCRALFVT
jgi:hypothetical protein